MLEVAKEKKKKVKTDMQKIIGLFCKQTADIGC